MSKRIASFVLFIAIIASLMLFSYVTAFAVDVGNDIDFLMALDMIEKDKFGKYDPDIYVSRGEFYKTVAKILNLNVTDTAPEVEENADTVTEKEYLFKDLAVGDKYSAAVKSLIDSGVIKADQSVNIKLNEYCTYEEVADIYISLLGFDEVSYYKKRNDVFTAQEIGILSKMVVSPNAFITQGVFASMTKSALLTNVYDLFAIEGKQIIKEQYENRTLLSMYHSIYVAEGVFEANEYTGLSDADSAVAEKHALINDVLINVADVNTDKYLGYNVTAVYREADGQNQLIYIVTNKRNKSLVITAKDYSDYKNGTLSYYDGRKSRKIRVNQAAEIIYNMKAVNSFAESVFDINNGSITCIDNNADGKYDVFVIRSFVNYIAEVIDISNETIYVKDAAPIKLNKYTYEIFSADGEMIDITYISKKDILSVMIDEADEFIRVYRSDNVVEGAVTSIDDDNIITLDDEYSFDVSHDFSIEKSELSVGDYGYFYIDINGNIAAFVPQPYNFETGYIKAIAFDDLRKKFEIKIFVYDEENDGKFVVYSTAKNVILDGRKKSNSDAYKAIKNTAYTNVVRFRLNSKNEIRILDTCASDICDYNDLLTVDIDCTGNENKYRYSGTTRNFTGKTLLNTDALVFVIPSDLSDEDSYAAWTVNELSSGAYYTDFITYRSQNPYECDVIVLVGYDINTGYYSNGTYLTVVTKIKTMIDEYGEETYLLSGFNRGAQVSYPVKKGLDISTLKEGDAIRISIDKHEEIKAYELVFSAKDKTINSSSNPSSSNFYARRFLYGKLYDLHDDIMVTTTQPQPYDNMSRDVLEYTRVGKNLYVYDSTMGAGARVQVGSYADLVPYTLGGSDCSNVLIYSYGGTVLDMLVIK